MCGRYAITLPPEAMRASFGYREQPNFPPRYNIAPTQPVPVIRPHGSARQFLLMRWGFIPGWVRDAKDFPLVINIRGESAAEKPSFRNALARRRCLMPADAFYEWRRSGTGKQARNDAFLFRRPDRGFFAFAALWETWSAPDGSEIDTVAMLTGPASGPMAAIHHRAPIILAAHDHDAWLDPGATPQQTRRLIEPPPDDLLEIVAIGPAINKVANDGPELQEPASAAAPAEPARKVAKHPEDDPQGSLF
ncbi:SOS response-associated peptidase [Bosea sp. (in: a-proteobacteria)]|uniref:SOS response-associated peptidase n=1 Tax=Bosea sp. (in: a-proteobacteria) TaxID=1871050 RepID=UPI00260CFF0D|nr:SOS response-associated peptidase [Bosea sp. (in: a-proteobacteria)]MCO5092451.1 SOS response-associated peptidase [Bosea sp. (in: a-proteobacteria)]